MSFWTDAFHRDRVISVRRREFRSLARLSDSAKAFDDSVWNSLYAEPCVVRSVGEWKDARQGEKQRGTRTVFAAGERLTAAEW